MQLGGLASEYLTLLFMMNPFGALPIYMDIAGRLPPWERRKVANTVAVVAASLLYLVALTGDALLRLYKISLGEFRFAGGIILIAIGLARLRGDAVTQAPDPRDAAAVPLATPLLVGPATMTYVIVSSHTTPLPVVLAAIAAAVATVWLIFELGEHILARLGRSAMKIMTRVTA
ncbi:MAG: MarC family protein, partial [Crenarchaeota archaeon]|nr:MarC family protein [Thermoproteota archaeon]